MDNYEIKKSELKIQVLSSVAGAKGEEGESMYEIAKKNGFEGTEQEFIAQYMNVDARIGYYECDTDSSTAAKTCQGASFILPSIPPYGGSFKVKFLHKNSAANPTLSINGSQAKPLYYNGAIASSTNTWEGGDVLDLYYDGTNFNARSVVEKFATGEKVKNVGIDDEPTAGSDNLVKSRGVNQRINNGIFVKRLIGFDNIVSYSEFSLKENTFYKITFNKEHFTPFQAQQYILRLYNSSGTVFQYFYDSVIPTNFIFRTTNDVDYTLYIRGVLNTYMDFIVEDISNEIGLNALRNCGGFYSGLDFTWEIGKTVGSTGNITNSNNSAITQLFNIGSYDTIICPLGNFYNDAGINILLALCEYDENQNFIKKTWFFDANIENVIKLNTNSKYVRFVFYYSVNSGIVFNITDTKYFSIQLSKDTLTPIVEQQSEEINQIKDSLGDITIIKTNVSSFSEWHPETHITGYYKYPTQTWYDVQSGKIQSTRIDVEGYDIITFLGFLEKSSSPWCCYAFQDLNGNVIKLIPYENSNQISTDELKEYVVSIPEGAKYIVLLLVYGGILNSTNIYCTLRKGKNVEQLISESKIFKTSEEVPNTSIINNLEDGGIHDILSAEQGKVLNDKIINITDELSDYVEITPYNNPALGYALRTDGTYDYSSQLSTFGRTYYLPINPQNKYKASFVVKAGLSYCGVQYFRSNDTFISCEYLGTDLVEDTLYTDVDLHIPTECNYIKIQYKTELLTSNVVKVQTSIISQLIDNSYRLTHLKPDNQGQLNTVKRMRQLTDLEWTPCMQLPRLCWGGGIGIFEDSFNKNTKYKGIPYARATQDNNAFGYGAGVGLKIGLYVSFETFITAISNPNTVMAESSFSLSGHNAAYYANICAGGVSYAIGTGYYTTADFINIPSGFTLIGVINDLDLKTLKLGDIVVKAEVHTAMVTDVIIEDGIVKYVEIGEVDTDGNENYNVLGTDLEGGEQGGVGRRLWWNVLNGEFNEKWGTYSIVRYNNISSVKYTPSPYIPMPDENLGAANYKMAILPYMGNNFRFVKNYIPSGYNKLIIEVPGKTHLRVKKDGVDWNENGTNDYYDITNLSEITIGFTEIGEYTAYACKLNGNNEIQKTKPCKWSVVNSITHL